MKPAKKYIVSEAQALAMKMHGKEFTVTVDGLRRPKIIHIQEVADLVWAARGTDEEIAAAWLHDIVEDTPVTRNKIREKFGRTVAAIVNELTDPLDYRTLSLEGRRERKRLQANHIKKKGKSVQLVKLADQTSNVRLLATDPTNEMTPKEIKDYIAGAKLVADACRGVSPLLDKLFRSAYRRGVGRYGSM